MAASIEELQKPFLTADQLASSWTIISLDTQLIDDGTYFIVEIDGQIAGWSRRATLYGGDQSPGWDAAFLNPNKDAAPHFNFGRDMVSVPARELLTLQLRE